MRSTLGNVTKTLLWPYNVTEPEDLQVPLEDAGVVVVLQLLIGKVDAQLLEVVGLELLEAKDVQQPCRDQASDRAV